MSLSERFEVICDNHRLVREAHAAHVRSINPAATDEDVNEAWMELTYEPELFRKVMEWKRLKRKSV
jgi:hypothetical protein